MTARADILGRIRATRMTPAEPFEPRYRRSTGLPREALLARFCQRLADYHAGVLHAADEGKIAGLAEARLAERGVASLVVAADLPASWRPRSPRPIEDRGLSALVLDGIAGVMTASRLAIAESGTVVFDCGPGQGRRVLTLLPDYHLCVVRAADIVGLLPEAMALLHERVVAGAPLTFISGPSATADIELDRVEGVHGPRTLDVILVAAA